VTPTRRNGFTLFEILAVLAIIAIVGAVSWPIYSAWLERERLQDGAEKVREHWLKARSLAMQHGREYRLVGIDPTMGFPIIDTPQNPGVQAIPAEVSAMPNGVRVESITAGPLSLQAISQPGMSSDVAVEAVLFRPNGSVVILGPDGMELSDVQLLLRGQGGEIRLHGRPTGEIMILSSGAH